MPRITSRRRSAENPASEAMMLHHQYPTKSQFIRHALKYLIREVDPLLFRRAEWEKPIRVLDHSAGTGVWNAVMMELVPESYRVNIEPQLGSPIRLLTAHEHYFGVRFQEYTAKYLAAHADAPQEFPLYDIVMGNGPFKELQEFLECGERLLKMGGLMYNLAPIGFLGTQDRIKTFYRVLTPWRVIHLPKRLSFTKDGKTGGDEYVLIVHKKGSTPRYAEEDWWFDWADDAPDIPEDALFKSEGVAPALQGSFLMEEACERTT